MPTLAADARALFGAAVRAVQAPTLLRRTPVLDALARPVDTYRRVVVLAVGKAALPLAGEVEALLEDAGRAPDALLVTVPHGYPASLPSDLRAPRRAEVVEAGHPAPDAHSQHAAKRALALADAGGPDDLVLVLVSGGGSALWAAPAGRLSLDDLHTTHRLLVTSGAPIDRINAVRKRLSQIKGGRLARTAAPAEVVTLAVSDVPGDDLSALASGPTVPDATTLADARRVLHDHDLWDDVPAAVRHHLETAGEETPKAHLPSRTLLLGTNRDALAAARHEAERRGYRVARVEADVQGEAREVARRQVQQALDASSDQPTCLLWGGETTVTVQGDGRGGRNQEAALAAALALDGTARHLVYLSAGTDGVDGPTPAAGAWADADTLQRARALGLDAQDHLTRNDSFAFFDALGQHVLSGPTHTNVMDVQVALVAARPHR